MDVVNDGMSGATVTVFDAIVIGAGAAGCFAAHELTRGGLSVLLLDAGPDIEPSRHFPVPPPRSLGVIDRVCLGLRGQHIQARCFPFNRATRHFYVNDRENPYTTADDKPFNWFRGRQVGGRLHTWGRVVPRFSDWELKPSTHGIQGIDWPVAYEDLAPFYSRVERFLGVHATCEGMPQRPDGEFIAPRPLSRLEEHIRDEIVKRWPARRFTAAPVVRHNPSRVPLPLIAAGETGKLSLRANAVVKRIHVDDRGARARGVEFIDRITKKPLEARGRIVILCASAIESVRILLNSACDQHPRGLGNSSGLLGRYLMDHCMAAIGGEVPGTLLRAYGPTVARVSLDPYDLASNYLYMPGFRNITERAPSRFVGSFSVLGFVGTFDRRFFFLGFGDMLPAAENRIRTTGTSHDAWGIPAAHLECSHSPNEHALIADMQATMRDMATGAGLHVRSGFSNTNAVVRRALYAGLWKHVLTRYNAFHPGSAIHEVGGARMGDDPRSSVLNQFNQCWDAPNVFVTDGACFVSSGHQAHTLTIMALTVRACDFIVAQHRTGNL